MEDYTTQIVKVKKLLLSGEILTAEEVSRKHRIFRLASIINKLKNKHGMPIHSELKYKKGTRTRWSEYTYMGRTSIG